MVTTIGLQTGALLAGAVLTETVFAFGGIGPLIADSITRPGLSRAAGASSCSSRWSTSLVNLLVDLSYASSTRGCGCDDRHRRTKRREKLDRLAGSRPRDDEPRRQPVARGVPPAAAQPGRDHRRASSSALFVLVAVFAPLLAPHDPTDAVGIDEVTPSWASSPASPPSTRSAATTSGRDCFTRLIYGARQTLLVGVAGHPDRRSTSAWLARCARRCGFGGWVDSWS